MLTCKVGDWVMFYRDGDLAIGQIVATGKTRVGDLLLYTTAGKVLAEDVIESRGQAEDSNADEA